MNMATIHISEADAVRDFAGLMAHVRLGAEIVIESEAARRGVMRPAVPDWPRRDCSPKSSQPPKQRGSSALLDGGFARDLEAVVNSHPEPLNPPAWD